MSAKTKQDVETLGFEALSFSTRLNLEIAKNAIDLLRDLSKKQELYLESKKFNPEVDVLDEEALALVSSELGFAIGPEHTINALIDKGVDFSVGDLTTAFRNIERLSDASRCAQVFEVFKQAEAAWKHLGETNQEITAHLIKAL